MRDIDRRSENHRESALTVRKEARPFYAALFVLQTFGLIARRFYIALMERVETESVSLWQALSATVEDGKIQDIIAISLSELERDGAKAVISTIVLMEVWDAMMATRDAVNDWLEKRREKARAEGIAEGIAEGRIEGIAKGKIEGIAEGRASLAVEIADWNERRLVAEANGEPFDEPIPGQDARN